MDCEGASPSYLWASKGKVVIVIIAGRFPWTPSDYVIAYYPDVTFRYLFGV